jgi:hypothetical protein
MYVYVYTYICVYECVYKEERKKISTYTRLTGILSRHDDGIRPNTSHYI